MSVIKANTIVEQQHDVTPVSFNFNDVQNAAQGQLNQIKLKAADVIKQALAEAEELRLKAEQQGQVDAVRNARKSLKQEVEAQAATIIPALKNVVDQITQAKQQWIQQWESSAIHVAVAVAEKIIHREIENRPEISQEMIRQTLSMASGCGQIKVHLNPKDIESMQRTSEMVLKEISQLAPSDIVPNENIAQGGCFVETQFGSIDNTIESQLKRIESELG
ncbi:MAG: FliH/SctL family protein [Pirellulales bacterium]